MISIQHTAPRDRVPEYEASNRPAEGRMRAIGPIRTISAGTSAFSGRPGEHVFRRR
jgi:hypothetical protein